MNLNNLNEVQKRIFQNKVKKGFNATDVNKEFCLLYGEVSEAYDAWRKGRNDFGEELADIAIYLLGIAEITRIDLGEQICRKIFINEFRRYDVLPNGTHVRIKDDKDDICSE